MRPPPPDDNPTAFADSPLYLLATLFAARRSKDALLERLTRRRLASLGIDVMFGNELPPRHLAKTKGDGRGE